MKDPRGFQSRCTNRSSVLRKHKAVLKTRVLDYKKLVLVENIVPGAMSGRVTPDPISNSEVKSASANGSRKARVGQCQERCFSQKNKDRPKGGF